MARATSKAAMKNVRALQNEMRDHEMLYSVKCKIVDKRLCKCVIRAKGSQEVGFTQPPMKIVHFKDMRVHIISIG